MSQRINLCRESQQQAKALAFGAQEMVELALYLAARAKGMPVETPTVRP